MVELTHQMIFMVGIEYAVKFIFNGGIDLLTVLKNDVSFLRLDQTLPNYIVSSVKIIDGCIQFFVVFFVANVLVILPIFLCLLVELY